MVTMDARTRVLIADGREDVREALTALLDATEEFEVAGQACSARDAVQVARELAADVIVIDPAGTYDHEVLRSLSATCGRLVILTLRDDILCRTTARAYNAVVVDKGASPEVLLQTLRDASPAPVSERKSA